MRHSGRSRRRWLLWAVLCVLLASGPALRGAIAVHMRVEDIVEGEAESRHPEAAEGVPERTDTSDVPSDGAVGGAELQPPSSDATADYTELAQDSIALLRSLSPRVDGSGSSSRQRHWQTLNRVVGPVLGIVGARGHKGPPVAKFAKADGLEELPALADSDPDDVKRAKALRTLETLAFDKANEEALFVLAELNFFAPFGHPRNLTRAFELYSLCSDKHGNATAQGMLGFMYATGFGAPKQNQAKAMLYYTFAALGQDPSSEMALGYRYLAGIGTQKNCDEAVWYYRKAAQKAIAYWQTGPPGGHIVPPSKHRLADDEGGTFGSGASGAGNPNPGGRNTGDGALTPDDVLQYWQYTAERGDATAQFLLGQLYHSGTAAVAQDYRQALRYFQLAAAQYDPPPPNPNGGPVQITHAHAQRLNAAAQAAGQVGQMYLRGEGVDMDNVTARQWFEKGAQHNEAVSLNGLGTMYLEGTGGVPRDLKRAYQLFLKAAEHNNANAQANLGDLYLRQGKKEYTNALKYFTLASRQGHLLAMFRLGDMYLEGQGTQSNCMVAAAFFKSVSERGDWHDPLMEDALDAYYDEDMETAFLDYSLSAERGYEVAQSNAAWMVDQGLYPAGNSAVFGPDRDPWALALVYWNRAANQGNVDARVKVGDYYYYGLGHEAVQSVGAKHARPNTPATGTATLSAGEAEEGAQTEKQQEREPPRASAPKPPGSRQSAWARLTSYLLGHPTDGTPNFERAAMYYQTAADSEHSSLAMWNLAWMHECGIGVERDFHLAKRYYDRSLSTNPEGYLPITVALAKLRAKQLLFSLFGLPASSGAGRRGAPKKPRTQNEQVVVPLDSLPAPGEKRTEPRTAEDSDSDSWEWWEKQGAVVESTTENVLIVVLLGILGLLLYVRGRRGEPYPAAAPVVANGFMGPAAGPAGGGEGGAVAPAVGIPGDNGLRQRQQRAGEAGEG